VYSQEWSEDGNYSIRAESYYPDEVLDEMARRVGNELDEEIIRRLGYVKPVRCRDCKRYEWREHLGRSYCHGEYPTEPDGFCAWGERRESE
jgi:hypothetical protein